MANWPKQQVSAPQTTLRWWSRRIGATGEHLEQLWAAKRALGVPTAAAAVTGPDLLLHLIYLGLLPLLSLLLRVEQIPKPQVRATKVRALTCGFGFSCGGLPEPPFGS